MKLYADEQYPYPVVKYLRDLGHDVVTVQEAGKANQRIPDERVSEKLRSKSPQPP